MRSKNDIQKDLDELFHKKEKLAAKHGDSDEISSSGTSDGADYHTASTCDFSVLTRKNNKEVKRISNSMIPQPSSPTQPKESEGDAEQNAGTDKILLLGEKCNIPSKPPFKKLQKQPFSHILVCDFEATCEGDSVDFPHEIIEFPVVVLDTRSLRVVAEFHSFVRPIKNPILTEFCTQLTGITQETVDAAEPLDAVVERFNSWLQTDLYPLVRQWREYYESNNNAASSSLVCSEALKNEKKRFAYDENNVEFAEEERMVCFATDGPWDMRRFMHECSVLRDKIDFPPLFYRFINVRHSYCNLLKVKQVKLTHMLRRLGMTFEGQRHSGLADSRNICRVLAELLARSYKCHHVSTIKYYHRGDKFLEGNQAAQELLEEFGNEREPRPKQHKSQTSRKPQKGKQNKAKK